MAEEESQTKIFVTVPELSKLTGIKEAELRSFTRRRNDSLPCYSHSKLKRIDIDEFRNWYKRNFKVPAYGRIK